MSEKKSSISKDIPLWLSWYSKILVCVTLFLIFAGAMVKSTESGLAVPDWPLSYGMLFPPMVGGIFYEHGHRMIASLVGFMTLLMLVFSFLYQKDSSLRKIVLFAFFLVCVQGLFGGLTVIFFLPAWISSVHALLAQSFFLVTILIAYHLSKERYIDIVKLDQKIKKKLLLAVYFLIFLLYIQLLIGAVMRHTESALAIYDFPLHAGEIVPHFDKSMLDKINNWRFMKNLDAVNMFQVVIHFLHRFFALVLTCSFCLFFLWIYRQKIKHPLISLSLSHISLILGMQLLLGILVILSERIPIIATLHVMFGAVLLGLTFLLALRIRNT